MAGTPLTGDAIDNIVALGSAYRPSALADPNLYGIMFTRSVPGFEPNEDAEKLARQTLKPLELIIRQAITDGVFLDVPPETIAVGCWAFVTGSSRSN